MVFVAWRWVGRDLIELLYAMYSVRVIWVVTVSARARVPRPDVPLDDHSTCFPDVALVAPAQVSCAGMRMYKKQVSRRAGDGRKGCIYLLLGKSDE